jgi:hypothetical protein
MTLLASSLVLLATACGAAVLPERSANYPDQSVYMAECEASSTGSSIVDMTDRVFYFTNDYEARIGLKKTADGTGIPSDRETHDGFEYHVRFFTRFAIRLLTQVCR